MERRRIPALDGNVPTRDAPGFRFWPVFLFGPEAPVMEATAMLCEDCQLLRKGVRKHVYVKDGAPPLPR